MGIFTRFTLRSLAKNRVRTAVTVAGIALSTALLAAVLTSVGSMQAALLQRTMDTEGSWHVFSSELTASDVSALAESDKVSDLATFTKGGTAALSGAASEVAASGRGAEEAPCAGPNTASVSR